ncbi:MAG: hypothetical protein CM15mP31_1380 [Gammaproteobacteria bacterium]|nr:MAG: hypothetical protein CM15mP31_1380 [Gammaproteobacteria bacterium]
MSEPKVKKPSLFRTVVMKIVWAWRRVMDVKYNPLNMCPIPAYKLLYARFIYCMESFLWCFSCKLSWIFNYDIIVSIVVHFWFMPLAFTNAIFVDAERDGAKWLQEWKEEQSRYKIVMNRLKTKNLVLWNPFKKRQS